MRILWPGYDDDLCGIFHILITKIDIQKLEFAQLFLLLKHFLFNDNIILTSFNILSVQFSSVFFAHFIKKYPKFYGVQMKIRLASGSPLL